MAHTLLLCGMALVLAGCAGQISSGPSSTWVSPPSVRLSPTEQAAFDSTGQLDRSLSEKGKNAVLREYARYLHMNRSTVTAVTQRAAKYLTYTRQVFRKHGLPEELAYLAIVESGYNPQAVSRSGAAGAWQFMPRTGTAYGLRQDDWMDERLDPYKSTEAAARYLKKLYSHFGDWRMAVAAYNAGEGKVMRAKRSAGRGDFFDLVGKNHTLSEDVRLRDETLAYVPRLLAVTKIMRNLSMLGFAPVYPERAEKMSPLTAAPGTDLMALAKAANMPWPEFRAYNAAHKRQITSTARQTIVYVPENRLSMASAYLRTAQPVRDCRMYTASRSDTWKGISKRMGVDVPTLLAANQGVTLKPGVTVLVPRRSQKPVNSRAAGSRPAAGQTRAAGGQATYVVQSGDNMWSIARKYNVTPQELMRWNNTSSDALQPGDKLVVRM